MFVGVDGAKRGWVAIALSDVGLSGAAFCSSFDAVMERFARASVIAVDMPLGLTDVGDREADRAARALLGRRGASVFNAPARAVLDAATFQEAQALSKAASGKGVSKQTFALVPKLREVDAFVHDERVREVHPEVSFAVLGEADLPPKKTWAGLHRRLGLLSSAGIELPADLGDAGAVAADDVIDAAIAAWSARRIARREARSFPGSPVQRDRGGRVLAIWA